MKINRLQLINLLESVEPGLSQRDIVEQSSCFVFTEGYLQTYNDEVSCRMEVETPLRGAVQAKPLLSTLRKMADEDVTLEQTTGELIVRGKNKRAGVVMEHDILLPVDKVELPKKWKTLPPEFVDAVAITQQCASKDASKFHLMCLHITPTHVEACDNVQLTRYNVALPIQESTLVKRESIKGLPTLAVTKISESDSWLHFKNSRGLVVSCRKFSGDYPDLSLFMKTKGEPTSLPKGLIEAAEIAEVFSSEEESNEILVELKPGKVRLSGRGVSGWYEEVRKLAYKGSDTSFMISPALLRELVKQHNEVYISDSQLTVDGGSFIYTTSLGQPTKSTSNE